MNKRSEYIETPRNDDRKNCNQEQEFILHIQIEFHFFLFVVLFLTFEYLSDSRDLKGFQTFKRDESRNQIRKIDLKVSLVIGIVKIKLRIIVLFHSRRHRPNSTGCPSN